MFKNKLYASIAAALFFIVGVFTLSDYGINWDEPKHYFRGQAYLRFFLTGKRDYQDLPYLKTHSFNDFYPDELLLKRSIYQNESYNFSYFLKTDSGHPPLNDILASFSNYIFYQKLGILGDIESYHLFILLVSSLLVWVVFRFTQELYGLFAGIVATLSLVLYPLFLGESHFNIKDPVEAAFYGLTIYGFYQGIVRKSWCWLTVSAFFCGCALGTKLNIVFLPFILLPWLFFRKKKDFLRNKKLLFSLILYPLIVLAIFYFSWPLLWGHPERIITHVFDRYKGLGYGVVYQPEEYLKIGGLNTYPWQWILYITPLVILFFSVIGILATLLRCRKERNAPSLLILFWFLVPIIRVTLPKMGIYGGVRQIMEFIPAMAILAGLGASQMVKWSNGQMVKWSKKKPFSHLAIQPLILLQALTLLMFLPIFIKMIQIHPNQNVYFNPLIGGLKGAKEKNLPGWGNSYGNAYRQGVNWLNENTEKNAQMAFGFELMSNLPNIWVREDIEFANRVRSGPLRGGEYLISSVTDPATSDRYQLRYPEKFLIPVYQVKVDDVPLLKVWKNDLEHTKPGHLEEEKIKEVNFEIKPSFLLIYLAKTSLITRIEFMVEDKKECEDVIDFEGSFELDGQSLAAQANVFGHKLDHPQPYYLFAADKAKIIKFHFAKEDSCLKETKDVNVYQLKNLKPEVN